MALRPFLRSTLDEYFGTAVACFPLRHRLVVDRLAIADGLDEHVTGGNPFANDLLCDGIGSSL